MRFWYNQGKIVTGCTTAITPDGSENGKEWCQLQTEEVKPNEKTWGYCVEAMDWD